MEEFFAYCARCTKVSPQAEERLVAIFHYACEDFEDTLE